LVLKGYVDVYFSTIGIWRPTQQNKTPFCDPYKVLLVEKHLHTEKYQINKVQVGQFKLHFNHSKTCFKFILHYSETIFTVNII